MKSLLKTQCVNGYQQSQLGQFHERELLQGFLQEDFVSFSQQNESVPRQFLDIINKIRSGNDKKQQNLEQSRKMLQVARQRNSSNDTSYRKNKYFQNINKSIDQEVQNAQLLHHRIQHLSNTLRILKGQVHYLSEKSKCYQSQQFKLHKLKEQAVRSKVNRIEMLQAERAENSHIEASRSDFTNQLKKSASIVQNSLTKIKKQYFSFLTRQRKIRERQRKVYSTVLELTDYERKLKFIQLNLSDAVYQQLLPVYRYINLQESGNKSTENNTKNFRCSTTAMFFRQPKQSMIPLRQIENTILNTFRRLTSNLSSLENVCNKNISEISSPRIEKIEEAPDAKVYQPPQQIPLRTVKQLLIIKRNTVSNMKVVYAFCNHLAEIKKKSQWFVGTQTYKDILSVVWAWPAECEPFEARIFDNLIEELNKVVAMLLKPSSKIILFHSDVDVFEEAYSSNFFKKAMAKSQMLLSKKRPKESINLDCSVVSVTKELSPKESTVEQTQKASISRLQMRRIFNRQYINTTKKTLKFSRSVNVSPGAGTQSPESRRIDIQKRDQSTYGAYVYMFRRNRQLQLNRMKTSQRFKKWSTLQQNGSTLRSISLQ